jgi:DnaJ family protein C protein 2
MVKLTKLADSLDWPDEELETITIQCAGKAFLQYQTLVAAGDDHNFHDEVEEDTTSPDEDTDTPLEEDSAPAIDLFSLSEDELAEVDYYHCLHLPYKPLLTSDDVKKAYRKACLKYHPDKSGRGEEDAVFLKVKLAFETLSTQKQAYDSTEMPFDETVPGENPKDFFKEYGAVFERNLHFDARLLPVPAKNSGSKASNNSKNRRKSKNAHKTNGPPPLGDDSTSIKQVHEFYDYWTHFSTWRDFGLQAARELETQDHLDQAESRFEKRWYQKEIDRRAKKLKQQEQARITTLVERALSCDPRLIQERKRLIEEKEERQRQKERDVEDQKRQAEEAKLAEQNRLEEEKGRKAGEKVQREKEKKLLRKTKQVFRKHVAEALASLQKSEHALEDEVDLICSELDREQLIKLNTNLESKSSPAEVLELIKKRATNVHDQQEEDAEAATQNGHATATPVKETSSAKKKIPFTKDEMTTLAKGVKKFPAGGANRWDAIAQYINNVCRSEEPRTKEECIEVFKKYQATRNGTEPVTPAAPAKPAEAAPAADETDAWTEEQDKLLQEALVEFPGSMDKNERWVSIAKALPGKSKKDCVERFKSIRDAIMKNKK